MIGRPYRIVCKKQQKLKEQLLYRPKFVHERWIKAENGYVYLVMIGNTMRCNNRPLADKER